jgi:hypothetical protein
MVGMLAAANNGVNAPKQVCREVFSSGAVEQAGRSAGIRKTRNPSHRSYSDLKSSGSRIKWGD